MSAEYLENGCGGYGELAPNIHSIPSSSSDIGEVRKLKKIKLSGFPVARFLDMT